MKISGKHGRPPEAGFGMMTRVPAMQRLLFPDPRPLVERLGREFFRGLPEQPGVYLMRDSLGAVLYVGKARNLRKRLASYRVANPDRMPRRHLRLLRAVVRIELELCRDEAAALARESELLLGLKPKFNRAGTWPSTPGRLAWRLDVEDLVFGVAESPDAGWRRLGPSGAGALVLRSALVRLLWRVWNPESNATALPAGWNRVPREPLLHLCCRGATTECMRLLERLGEGRIGEFCAGVSGRLFPAPAFERAWAEADLECVRRLMGKRDAAVRT